MKKEKDRIVLLATIGTSPAVLTETIWALAHNPDEPIIPDEVVVITTGIGKNKLIKEFFELGNEKENLWNRFKNTLKKEGLDVEDKLLFGPVSQSICVPATKSQTNDLDDIITTEDNFLLADFLIKEIRKYTEDSGVQLFTSIAGGRKTMSALMLSCMSLLGRYYDHVLHVLVNSPFDGRVDPPFYYPTPKIYHKDMSGKKHKSTDAKIELIDIPYVKTRGWYQEKFSDTPPSYTRLVEEVQANAPDAQNKLVEFKFDLDKCVLLVDGVDVKLSPVEFVALIVGLEFSPRNLYEVLWKMSKAKPSGESNPFHWVGNFRKSDRFKVKEDNVSKTADVTIPKIRSEIKKKLKKACPILASRLKDIFPRSLTIEKCSNIRISVDMKKFKKLLNYDNISGV